MKLFNLKKILLFLLLIPSILFSVPMYNQYDPFAYHTIHGINKGYRKQDSKFQANLQLSPFYQHAAYARDKEGLRVPEGDIFGRWNMFGLFYGVSNNEIKAAPTSNPFSLAQAPAGTHPYIPDAATRNNYPNLSDAWRVLDKSDEGSGVIQYDTTNVDYNYTNPDNYDNSLFNKYMPLIYTNYEKFGLRGEINFNCKSGLGINIKSGVIDYKQTPEFEDAPDFTHTFQSDDNNGNIYTYLRKLDVMNNILSEININIDSRQETTLEDTYIELYYQLPFEVMNDDDEHVVTLVPYISAGIWMPTGKEKSQDAVFSLPTGNDGFWGITLDGMINFDLPGSMQFGFGAGAAYYFERSLDGYRIASHKDQQGIFPWKAKINKEPGLLWHFDASMKAEEFIDNFSASLDFIYLRHNKDKITMREDNADRNDYFVPSVNEENSKWWATMLQGGLEYKFSQGLQMGIGFQAHLSGRRVYRNTTILGTISFVF